MATAAARSLRPNCSKSLVLLGLAVCLLSWSSVVRGDDPDPVLDFCIAEFGQNTGVWQTGTEDGDWTGQSDPSQIGVAIAFNDTTDSDFPCKDLSAVKVTDFVFGGLANPGKVTSTEGSKVTKASVTEFPGLNTLQLSAARIDFSKNGLNPPHVHPRATELLYVLSGSLFVGFVDTNNTLFEQTLQTGDLFVFPKGLLHFQMEVGQGTASALSSFDSQNPGTSQSVAALLGSNPAISANVIEAAFDIDHKTFSNLVWGFSQVH